jgi:hypothetical protein
MRVENVVDVCRFICSNNLPYVLSSNGEIIGIDPKLCPVNEHGFVLPECAPFILHVNTHTVTPNIAPPLTVFYSYNRSAFLELALRSFAASTGTDFPNQKIVIILNGSKDYPETRRVALSFARQHQMQEGFIEVYDTVSNAGFTAVGIAMFLHPHEQNILIHEDDFLLPATVRHLYPFWTRKFAHLVNNGFDLAAWASSPHNRPLLDKKPLLVGNHLLRKTIVEESCWPKTKYSWIPSYIEKISIGAQCICFRSAYYRQCLVYRPQDYFVTDSSLIPMARQYIVPQIFGNHIGWDQEVFGYGSHYRPGKYPERFPQKNTVINALTGVSTEIDLSLLL